MTEATLAIGARHADELLDELAGEVTALLRRWNDGPRAALDRVLPMVAAELRRMAASFLKGESPNHTLQPTALVHELYLRLLHLRRNDWRDRSHFFGFAARSMRRILVDHARAKSRLKRGGRFETGPLENAENVGVEVDFDLVALDQALDELARLDPRQHHIVELHVFTGLTFDQIADLLQVGSSTVRRHWSSARIWLFDRLNPEAED